MNAINKTTKLLGTATLVLALSMFDFSLKPQADFQPDSLARFIQRINLINTAQAGILDENNGSLPKIIRFMYMLINGPGDNGYPDGYDGPDNGFLGMIREVTGPDALGGGLESAGYSSCSSIPSTGSASMTDSDGTFTMHFETPLKTIPSGYTGSGSKFDKRVVVDLDGTTFLNIEFNCDTTVGWMRMTMGDSGVTSGTLRNIEVYYDTNNSANSKLELYMYYEPGTSTGNEYFVAKFRTLSDSQYKFWIIRSVDQDSGDEGFRAAAYGDSSSNNVNAYMQFSDGDITDTSTDYTDNGTVASGDVQCIDFNTPDSPKAGTGCGSLSLDSTAGSPIIDSADGFSINWTADTTNGLKNDMTALADPV